MKGMAVYMKFKKIVSGILLSALIAVTAASCGQSATVDVEAAADTLYHNITFEDTMEPLDASMLSSIYSDVQSDDIVKSKVYTSTTATAEEIAVFEAKDAAAASRLETIVNNRIQEQKDIYADYAPLEVSRLEKAVVRKEGNYLFFCVAADKDKVESEIDALLK